MKKILILACAMLFAAPSLFSQSLINENVWLRKIERSDSDIANPKKSGKASTWINRGETFYGAATEISKYLYEGVSAEEVIMSLGQPTAAEVVTIGGRSLNKGVFEYADVYLDELNIPVSWEVTKEIYPGALAKAAEAYSKAYEIDGQNAKTAQKVQEGLKNIYDAYSKTGASYYMLAKYDKAAASFINAYEISKLPGVTIPDTDVQTLLHDAGISFFFAGDAQNSVKYLTMAEEIGYHDADIYYLIYHAYRDLGGRDALETAKAYLEKGLAQYPTDAQILESISEAYVLLGEDPGEVLSKVEAAVNEDPKNPDMWSALGVLYSNGGDYDKAIDAFEHMVELIPDSYIANNNLGLSYIKKAEVILDELNAQAAKFSTQAEYDAEKMKAFAVYAQAVPYLEKAHSIDPSNAATLEILKNVTFRIREMDGMQAKYEKYDAELKALNK